MVHLIFSQDFCIVHTLERLGSISRLLPVQVVPSLFVEQTLGLLMVKASKAPRLRSNTLFIRGTLSRQRIWDSWTKPVISQSSEKINGRMAAPDSWCPCNHGKNQEHQLLIGLNMGSTLLSELPNCAEHFVLSGIHLVQRLLCLVALPHLQHLNNKVDPIFKPIRRR